MYFFIFDTEFFARLAHCLSILVKVYTIKYIFQTSSDNNYRFLCLCKYKFGILYWSAPLNRIHEIKNIMLFKLFQSISTQYDSRSLYLQIETNYFQLSRKVIKCQRSHKLAGLFFFNVIMTSLMQFCLLYLLPYSAQLFLWGIKSKAIPPILYWSWWNWLMF